MSHALVNAQREMRRWRRCCARAWGCQSRWAMSTASCCWSARGGGAEDALVLKGRPATEHRNFPKGKEKEMPFETKQALDVFCGYFERVNFGWCTAMLRRGVSFDINTRNAKRKKGRNLLWDEGAQNLPSCANLAMRRNYCSFSVPRFASGERRNDGPHCANPLVTLMLTYSPLRNP